MKKKIHPQYFEKAVIECACGNVIKTGSTREKMAVEICGACHPFYTGKKKSLDVTGRVDRFNKRMEKTVKIKAKKEGKKIVKKAKEEKTSIAK